MADIAVDGDLEACHVPTAAAATRAEAFDAFYRACCGRLSGQLYLLTGDREEARDCVQEALERAWTRWGRVSDMDDPKPGCGRSRDGSR